MELISLGCERLESRTRVKCSRSRSFEKERETRYSVRMSPKSSWKPVMKAGSRQRGWMRVTLTKHRGHGAKPLSRENKEILSSFVRPKSPSLSPRGFLCLCRLLSLCPFLFHLLLSISICPFHLYPNASCFHPSFSSRGRRFVGYFDSSGSLALQELCRHSGSFIIPEFSSEFYSRDNFLFRGEILLEPLS